MKTFNILLDAKVKPRSKPGFYIEDFPFLLSLVPVGTNMKKRYKEALDQAMTDPETTLYFIQVFERFISLYEKVPFVGYIRLGVTRHGIGQNVLLAFKEFLDEALPAYWDAKHHKGFTENRGNWVNLVEFGDDLGFSDEEQPKIVHEEYGFFEDEL